MPVKALDELEKLYKIICMSDDEFCDWAEKEYDEPVKRGDPIVVYAMKAGLTRVMLGISLAIIRGKEKQRSYVPYHLHQ